MATKNSSNLRCAPAAFVTGGAAVAFAGAAAAGAAVPLGPGGLGVAFASGWAIAGV